MSAKIAQALHKVMQSVGYVQKTGKNSFHGYKYAGEADLLEKLRPAMLEAGLLLIPSISDVSEIDAHGITTVRMEYTLVHKDGDVWPEKIGAAGSGGDKNKNGVGDKGLYKAITGANKYLLFKLFQIETGDDPENEAPPKPERAKRADKTFAEDARFQLDQFGNPLENIPFGDPSIDRLPAMEARPDADRAGKELVAHDTVKSLLAWGAIMGNRVDSWPENWSIQFRNRFEEHKNYLIAKEQQEAA